MTEIEQQCAFHAKNRQKLRKKLGKKHELIVIAGNSLMQASADRAFPFEQDSHFFYLTGVTEPEVTLVMDGEDEYLIIPERDAVRTAFEGAIDADTMRLVSGIDRVLAEPEAWPTLRTRVQSLKKVATVAAPQAYIEHYEMFTNPSRQRLTNRLTEAEPTLELYDIRAEITLLRMIKTPYELKMIKRAIKETAKLFKAIERVRGKATNEADLWAEISRITVKNQLTNAYEPIIASGQNAITLHYVKNNAPLDKEGMLLLDIGLRYQGYSADITRTISFKPTQRQYEVFGAVLAVHTYALSILKPAITMREYEDKVQEYMGEQLMQLGLIKENKKGLIREFYPHSTSHFLGIDVHDVGDYERPLAPNMVLTVEPGIYIKDENIGIRLEDDVVITKTGAKVLSDALPKSLRSLTMVQ